MTSLLSAARADQTPLLLLPFVQFQTRLPVSWREDNRFGSAFFRKHRQNVTPLAAFAQVLPLCSGNLFDWRQQQCSNHECKNEGECGCELELSATLGVMLLIILAQRSLLYLKIVHLDLKLENILMGPDQRSILISDFSKARPLKIEDGGRLTSFVPLHHPVGGNIGSLAPELNEANSNTESGSTLDFSGQHVFALGNVLFTLMCGCPPLQDYGFDGKYTYEKGDIDSAPDSYPSGIKELLKMMVHPSFALSFFLYLSRYTVLIPPTSPTELGGGDDTGTHTSDGALDAGPISIYLPIYIYVCVCVYPPPSPSHPFSWCMSVTISMFGVSKPLFSL